VCEAPTLNPDSTKFQNSGYGRYMCVQRVAAYIRFWYGRGVAFGLFGTGNGGHASECQEHGSSRPGGSVREGWEGLAGRV